MNDQLFTGSYPSDALTEAKMLRADRDELLAENKRLREANIRQVERERLIIARVVTLEALLGDICDEYDLQPWGPVLHQIGQARAALQQEGGV